MISFSIRQRLYCLLKPWADRFYLWLQSRPSGSIPSAGAALSQRVITSPAEVDAELAEVDRLFLESDEAGRKRLSQWSFLPALRFPRDPYSDEYAQAQLENYKIISGRSEYEPAINEHSPINYEAAKRMPFPYFTKSPALVGEQFILQGALIRALDLPPGASIIEFGPGWGNTTLHMAMMGFDLTAVEIEPDFARLIQYRAGQAGVDIDVVLGDMLSFKSDRQFDGALFFESFHHCSDHLRLLRNLKSLLKPDGLLVFGGEPIGDFAHPWGFVRNDGLTTWSIRRHGWFELGFNTSYFLRTLLYLGWLPKHIRGPIGPISDVFTARPFHDRLHPHLVSLPPDESQGWNEPESEWRQTRGNAVLSCAREIEVTRVRVCLVNFAPNPLAVTVRAGGASTTINVPLRDETVVVVERIEDWRGQIDIQCPSWRPQSAYGNGDPRDLGVAVKWVELGA